MTDNIPPMPTPPPGFDPDGPIHRNLTHTFDDLPAAQALEQAEEAAADLLGAMRRIPGSTDPVAEASAMIAAVAVQLGYRAGDKAAD